MAGPIQLLGNVVKYFKLKSRLPVTVLRVMYNSPLTFKTGILRIWDNLAIVCVGVMKT